MYVEDSESFKQYFRMDRNTFFALLQEIAPLVEKRNTTQIIELPSQQQSDCQ